jgi:hypothetical protein
MPAKLVLWIKLLDHLATLQCPLRCARDNAADDADFLDAAFHRRARIRVTLQVSGRDATSAPAAPPWEATPDESGRP